MLARGRLPEREGRVCRRNPNVGRRPWRCRLRFAWWLWRVMLPWCWRQLRPRKKL